MITTRIYRALKDLEWLTYIHDARGKRHAIHFTGGTMYPRRVNGTFSTSNPDVIEALDNSKMNEVLYTCLNKNSKPSKPKIEKIEEVEGIVTVQEARDFLMENVEGLTKAKLTNRKVILGVAAQHGYSFPDLPTE